MKAARKKAGLNQKDLAKLAGMSQVTISDIETGRNKGSRDIVALATALNVSAEWLTIGCGAIGTTPDSTIIAEFAAVYSRVTDEGRAFLRSTITATKSAFAQPDESSNTIKLKNQACKLHLNAFPGVVRRACPTTPKPIIFLVIWIVLDIPHPSLQLKTHLRCGNNGGNQY